MKHTPLTKFWERTTTHTTHVQSDRELLGKFSWRQFVAISLVSGGSLLTGCTSSNGSLDTNLADQTPQLPTADLSDAAQVIADHAENDFENFARSSSGAQDCNAEDVLPVYVGSIDPWSPDFNFTRDEKALAYVSNETVKRAIACDPNTQFLDLSVASTENVQSKSHHISYDEQADLQKLLNAEERTVLTVPDAGPSSLNTTIAKNSGAAYDALVVDPSRGSQDYIDGAGCFDQVHVNQPHNNILRLSPGYLDTALINEREDGGYAMTRETICGANAFVYADDGETDSYKRFLTRFQYYSMLEQRQTDSSQNIDERMAAYDQAVANGEVRSDVFVEIEKNNDLASAKVNALMTTLLVANSDVTETEALAVALSSARMDGIHYSDAPIWGVELPSGFCSRWTDVGFGVVTPQSFLETAQLLREVKNERPDLGVTPTEIVQSVGGSSTRTNFSVNIADDITPIHLAIKAHTLRPYDDVHLNAVVEAPDGTQFAMVGRYDNNMAGGIVFETNEVMNHPVTEGQWHVSIKDVQGNAVVGQVEMRLQGVEKGGVLDHFFQRAEIMIKSSPTYPCSPAAKSATPAKSAKKGPLSLKFN